MASPNTSTNGQIQPRSNGAAVAKPKEAGLAGLLQSMGPEIARALPKHITPDRMARVCLTALRTTPGLVDCTPQSFAGAVMACAQLGLEPNSPLGHAYLIPYKDRRSGTTICQVIIGYQGMIELAYRSGRVSSVAAHVVRDGDEFEFSLGLHPVLRHVPSDAPDREERAITHAYAVAQIKDGEPIAWVMSGSQIEARRKRGASGRGVRTPWDTDREAMSLKTAVRSLFKWIPKSPEIATAIAIDDSEETRRPLSVSIPEIGSSLSSLGLHETFDADTGEVIDAPTDAELAASERGDA